MRSPAILVVDDDVDTCRNLSDILTDLGYRVDVAHDGPGALEMVRRRAYDIALLDLKMPGMDGVTLYREVRKLRAETVALIVTAFAGTEAREQALAAGAWQVLAKPVELDRLLGLVDQALGQPLVMVVDDDTDLCASLWDVLRDRGFRVSVAHTQDEAQQRLQDCSYKVVLIDMKLSDGDGSSVFRLVRQASPDARTVVITGHPSELDRKVQQVVAEGVDAICYKPFDLPELFKVLDGLCKGAEEKG